MRMVATGLTKVPGPPLITSRPPVIHVRKDAAALLGTAGGGAAACAGERALNPPAKHDTEYAARGRPALHGYPHGTAF
jgi:hypothetical protein